MAQEVNAVAQGAAATQVAVEKLAQIVQSAMSAPPLPPQMPPPMPYGTEPIPPVGAEPIAGAGPVVPPQMALPV
jgi:hypothetical protein